MDVKHHERKKKTRHSLHCYYRSSPEWLVVSREKTWDNSSHCSSTQTAKRLSYVHAHGSLGAAPSGDHGAVGQTEGDGVQGADVRVELVAVKHLPSHHQHTCKTRQRNYSIGINNNLSIFIKREVLSVETILSAYTRAHTHAHTHTHTHTHARTQARTHARVGLRRMKTAARNGKLGRCTALWNEMFWG